MSDSGTASSQSTLATELVAGVTTFFAMAYVAFANPAILSAIGLPPAATFLWTCLIAALASGAAGHFVRLPTALACGMGLNAFAVSYATHSPEHPIGWQMILVTCGVASIGVAILSLVGARRVLINAIPPQIFAAVKAGVGAVLTSLAFRNTSEFSKHVGTRWWAWGLFALGLLIILGLQWWYANRVSPDGQRGPDSDRGSDRQPQPAWVEIVNNSSFLLSIVAVLLVAWLISPLERLTPGPRIVWAWTEPGALAAIQPDIFYDYLSFGISVLFLLLLDIAGSPIDFVRHSEYGAHLPPEAKDIAVSRGFLVDSVANVLAPVFGVTPVIYYIENHVGWRAGGRTGRVALVVAGLFLLLAIFGAICIFTGSPITQIIAPFCVMPTLFYVGLMIIAESFMTPTGDDVIRDARGHAFYFIPAAITTVLASIATLDTALAAGILAYGMLSLFPKSYLGYRTPPDHAALGVVYLGAITVLVFSLVR